MKGVARGVVWWPGIDADIENQVQTCAECQEHQNSPAAASLHLWEWPAHPWERLHIDYAGPFLDKMFLVMVDAHSKWLEIEMVPSATSAHNAKLRRMAFHSSLCLTMAVFTSGEFKEYLERNVIRHVRSSPCHPASSGLAEWYVQTFKTSLKKSGDVDVRQQLSQFFFCYHSAFHYGGSTCSTVDGTPSADSSRFDASQRGLTSDQSSSTPESWS